MYVGFLDHLGDKPNIKSNFIRKCQLQIATCHGHLPSTSTRIKSCVAAAADLQHLLKGVQGKDKEWGTLVLGEVVGGRKGGEERNWQDRSSDRYFQELILWAQFLYLLIFRKPLKIPHGDVYSSWLAENFKILAEAFCKNMCLIVSIPPSPKSHL